MSRVEAGCVGTVWKVLVAPGDRVVDGDVLVMLESMKMEIPIEAETDGVVIEVHVTVGDTVSDEDILVTLED